MLPVKYMDELRLNPNWPMSAMKQRIRKELKLEASRSQIYRARKHAMYFIHGHDVEQYAMLWDY